MPGKHLLHLGRLGTAHRLADLRQKDAQTPQESGDRGIDTLANAYRPDVGEEDIDNNISEQNANHAVPGNRHIERRPRALDHTKKEGESDLEPSVGNAWAAGCDPPRNKRAEEYDGHQSADGGDKGNQINDRRDARQRPR